MTSRDTLLRQLADGEWHPEPELGPTPYDHGIKAWIRLLRLSGFTIDQRTREGVVEYRLVAAAPGVD